MKEDFWILSNGHLGSTCRVIVQFLSEPLENVSVDLLPLGEEKTLEVGFYSSIVGGYLHKCLLTMKEKEISHLSFHHSSQLVRLSLALLSFQRVAEIYSMSMTDLYTFALKHKENANRFFQEKFFDHAFELYHRSLSYLFNFVTEEPSTEHLDRFNRLALTIYSNMAACQLISGNSAGVIENCSSALQIDPNFSKALFRRACAYAQINDYELALTDLHAAQSLEPNDAKINEVLQETKQRFEHYRKNLGQALKNLF